MRDRMQAITLMLCPSKAVPAVDFARKTEIAGLLGIASKNEKKSTCPHLLRKIYVENEDATFIRPSFLR